MQMRARGWNPGIIRLIASNATACSCFGEFPQCRCIEDDNRPVFKTNPFAQGPRPQLLVDALACHADHFADFLLRNRNGAPFGVKLALLGQTEQRAGKSPRQILQNELLDLIACLPNPRAQQLDELHGERWLAADEGEKVAAVNDENLANGVRRGVGAPRMSIQQRHLAEQLPGPGKIEDRVAAVGRGDTDLHRAADNNVKAGARIIFGEKCGASLQYGMLGAAAKLVERLGRKIVKIRMLAQDRQFNAPRLGHVIRCRPARFAAHEQRIARSLPTTTMKSRRLIRSPRRRGREVQLDRESNRFCGFRVMMNALRRMWIAM
jgi:hypothetical protein